MRYALEDGAWLDALIENTDLPWDGESLAELAMALPPTSEVWDLVESWQHGAGDLYWQRVPLGYIRDAPSDLSRAVQTLIEFERFYRAINLIGGYSYSSKGELPVEKDIVVRVLSEAVKHDPRAELGGMDFGSLSHHVSQLLDLLENAGLPQDQLGRLEWEWMPTLRHTSHGLRNLQYMTAENPASFVHLLTLAYKGEGDPPRNLSDHERAVGEQAHELSEELRRVPGLTALTPPEAKDEGDVVFPKGEVDESKLKD